MKGHIWPPLCRVCGKILSYSDLAEPCPRWTPHGHTYDTCPPEEVYAHTQCFRETPSVQEEAKNAYIPYVEAGE